MKYKPRDMFKEINNGKILRELKWGEIFYIYWQIIGNDWLTIRSLS